ncbi:MAG TPA: DUF6798 domain-containing protein [Planctomycetaceae bacterium]|nr:DUF6798 domain-containing protein [Planctomycetaceae bacterium]
MRYCGVVAAVFASFFLFAAVRSPVPGINEPHYLARAKHSWNPDWCRGDFFLESAEAHVVFYHTVGRLTQWCSLEQAAWTGRVVALAVLAGGWTALVRRLVPGRWSPWWASCVFLLLAAVGNFSGEWIVGGVEGKVFAYGLLFWAMALAGRRVGLAAMCAGLAVSFHPVVGLWGLVAAAVGQVLSLRGRGGGLPACRSPGASSSRQATASESPETAAGGPPAATMRLFGWVGNPSCGAMALLVLFALPGLVPAMRMLGGASPEAAAAANRIQAFDRLKHHLDPLEFPATAYAGYGLLIALWLLGRRFADRRSTERRFMRIVAGSIVIALAGLAIGLRPESSQNGPFLDLRAALLKFYPFRLADVLVPLAASVTLVGLASRWARSEFWPRYHLRSALRRRLLWPVFTAALAVSLVLPAIDRNPSRLAADELADWLDICRWVSRNTPVESSFFTPPESWAFKWYAQRAEYVTRKDCPQDAAGIIEWRRRMDERWRWLLVLRDSLRARTYCETLDRLGGKLGVTHAIVYTGWRAPAPALYRNRTFAVYATHEACTVRANRLSLQDDVSERGLVPVSPRGIGWIARQSGSLRRQAF